MKKYTSNISYKFLLAIGVFAMMTITSCNKKDTDNQLTNIPAERKDLANAEILNAQTISGNKVLEDRVNGVDYLVTGIIEVNSGTLMIQPGVTIMFEEGAGLVIKEEGVLIANGEDGNKILFTSKSGKRAGWAGITVLSNKSENQMHYCTVEQAGAETSYGAADIIVGSGANNGKLQLANCEITTSNNVGISLSQNSKLTEFTANVISTNTSFPISVHPTALNSLLAGNTFQNNGKEFIQVLGSIDALTEPVSFQKFQEPYCLDGAITSYAAVNIAAGSIIHFGNNAALIIDGQNGNGTLHAVGTIENPIALTGVYSGSGFWNFIEFKGSGAGGSIMQYCTISGGGANVPANHAMVNITDGSAGNIITIRNCNIANSSANGIYVQGATGSFNSDIATSNTFTNIANQNVFLEIL